MKICKSLLLPAILIFSQTTIAQDLTRSEKVCPVQLIYEGMTVPKGETIKKNFQDFPVIESGTIKFWWIKTNDFAGVVHEGQASIKITIGSFSETVMLNGNITEVSVPFTNPVQNKVVFTASNIDYPGSTVDNFDIHYKVFANTSKPFRVNGEFVNEITMETGNEYNALFCPCEGAILELKVSILERNNGGLRLNFNYPDLKFEIDPPLTQKTFYLSPNDFQYRRFSQLRLWPGKRTRIAAKYLDMHAVRLNK